MSNLEVATLEPGKTARPAHVPKDRVFEIDMYALKGIENGYHEAWTSIKTPDMPDLIWTPLNGGHWIATNGKTIAEIYNDPTRFSSQVIFMPKEAGEKYEMVPTRMDPPEHTPYRQALSKGLNQRMVRRFEEKARQFSVELIEGFMEKGSCDFAKDYAEPFPVKIFMALADLPMEDVPMLTHYAHLMTRPEGSTPEERGATLERGNAGFFAYVDPVIRARRGRNGEDLISLMVNSEINGELISHEKAIGLVGLLLLAGLDTVVAFLNFVMTFLAKNPDIVADLQANPTKIVQGAEELFRRFPVISEGRMVAKDQDYAGVHLEQGEMILLPTALAGLDPLLYENPWKIDFERKGVFPHATFGAGPHRCAGALFARLELVATLEEWLKRIPAFSLRKDEKQVFNSGMVANVENVPLTWSVTK